MEYFKKIGNFIDKVANIHISRKLEYLGLGCMAYSYFNSDQSLAYVGSIIVFGGVLLHANNKEYDDKIKKLEIRLERQEKRFEGLEENIKDRNIFSPF